MNSFNDDDLLINFFLSSDIAFKKGQKKISIVFILFNKKLLLHQKLKNARTDNEEKN
jgi:hypothetical protein